MTANVVHPADLERMLEARVVEARSKRTTTYRSHTQNRRPRRRLGSVALIVGSMLALSVTAVFADGGSLDVIVADSNGYKFDTTNDNAIVEYIGKDNSDFGSSGTGVINSFLQTQDTPSEEGYNTDGTTQFDTGSSPTFNRSILVSEIPVVECEALDPAVTDPAETGLCWELFADINDSNANDPDAAQIQLTELEIWLTADAEITGYVQAGDAGFPSGASKEYDFEGEILINDVNSGSGRGDLRYLVPLTGIDLATLAPDCEYGSGDCLTFFVVYTEWGDTEGGDFISDSGFEEWTVKEYPSLQIVKNSVGGDGTFDFAVMGDPTDPPDTSPSIITTGGTGSTPTFVIDPGTYTIDELDPPAGWSFTGAVCSFNDEAAQAYTEAADLVIAKDDHVVCTFTNVSSGTVRIIKDAIPDDPQDFDYSTTGGLSPSTFVLDDDGDATLSNLQTFSNVVPGTYTVTETGETGWDLTDLDCDDDASTTPSTVAGSTATIEVDPGETVTCTFENTKQGTVRIIKDAIPDDPQDFDYSTTGGLSPSTFVLDDDGDATLSNLQTFSNVVPGTYTVTETGETGWDLTDLDCDDDASTTPSTVAGSTATIEVDPGETVTCTFENTKQGTVRIIKDAIPDDPQDFDYSTTGGLSPSTFVLDDDGDATLSNLQTFSNVVPGTYTVTETGETGWDLTDLDCDDDASTTPSTVAGSTATIEVDPGETVTCTFENSKLPTIIVEKITTGVAGGPFGFTTTGGHGLSAAFNLTTSAPGAAGKDSETFPIDSGGIGEDFSVTESSLPAGFVLTDVSCVVTTAGAAGTTTGQDLGTKTGTITNLTAGTTVTCTFVNSGALTTRTQGFWSTHSWLVALVWNPAGGTIDTFVHDGMTDAERTLCGQVLTVEQVMGGFWSNIAKETDGDKRSRLDHARMQLAQQLLAAILNNQLFGSAPSGISIDDAKAAFCGDDVDAIKAAASAMAAFNESGDAGLFTPGGSADAKTAREIADRAFWDDLP